MIRYLLYNATFLLNEKMQQYVGIPGALVALHKDYFLIWITVWDETVPHIPVPNEAPRAASRFATLDFPLAEPPVNPMI